MKNKKSYVIIIIFILLLLAIVFVLNYQKNNYGSKKIGKVSVILYGSDRFENLRKGIESALEDYELEISFVNMSVENSSKEQNELIEREINNGAEGILLAVSNSEEQSEIISKLKAKVPMVTIESGCENVESFISADNYEMGATIARELMARESDIVKIAIVTDNKQRNSVLERHKGFYDTITTKYSNIIFWDREDYDKSSKLFAQREITKEAVDIVVALDNTSVEAVVDAAINLRKNVKIYGIANSEKAIYHLDNETIKVLVYQDEFSIGYVGLKTLMGDKSYLTKDASEYITYVVVDNKNIHLPEMEHLVFPFAK